MGYSKCFYGGWTHSKWLWPVWEIPQVLLLLLSPTPGDWFTQLTNVSRDVANDVWDSLSLKKLGQIWSIMAITQVVPGVENSSPSAKKPTDYMFKLKEIETQLNNHKMSQRLKQKSLLNCFGETLVLKVIFTCPHVKICYNGTHLCCELGIANIQNSWLR